MNLLLVFILIVKLPFHSLFPMLPLDLNATLMSLLPLAHLCTFYHLYLLYIMAQTLTSGADKYRTSKYYVKVSVKFSTHLPLCVKCSTKNER